MTWKDIISTVFARAVSAAPPWAAFGLSVLGKHVKDLISNDLFTLVPTMDRDAFVAAVEAKLNALVDTLPYELLKAGLRNLIGSETLGAAIGAVWDWLQAGSPVQARSGGDALVRAALAHLEEW